MRCRSCNQADVIFSRDAALSHMYLIHCAQSPPGSPPFKALDGKDSKDLISLAPVQVQAWKWLRSPHVAGSVPSNSMIKPRLAVNSVEMAVPKTPTTFRDCHI